MTPTQIEGITKARLVCNVDRKIEDQFADNAAYVAWVCQFAGLETLPDYAADSYAAQHAGKTVEELEAEVAAAAKAAK